MARLKLRLPRLAPLQGLAATALLTTGVYGLAGLWWACVTLAGVLFVGAVGSG